MNISQSSVRMTRAARRISLRSDLSTCLQSSFITSRCLSTTSRHNATPTLHPTNTRDQSVGNKARSIDSLGSGSSIAEPGYKSMSPAQRAARAAERARDKLQEQQQKYVETKRLGGLVGNSFFADEGTDSLATANESLDKTVEAQSELSRRIPENMSLALNPRPNARMRWQRKKLIKHVRRRGRLTRELQIARTERNHLSKSYFFKTSMKKLAPLARQIAGKSIDEAILQMRFSKKKAAKEVRAHLIQARDEAVVAKGMGLNPIAQEVSSANSPIISDPGIAPPLPHQNPTKSTKSDIEKSETDIYVAQAWVNRGPYGMEPEYRARGRVNILRPPWTGISVLLKEEKTRTREKADKEAKAIRKRMGKNMWVQLPDRPITRQSQYLLW